MQTLELTSGRSVGRLGFTTLIAFMLGSVACSTETVRVIGTPGGPGSDTPGDGTTDIEPTDPSTKGDPTDKDTPAPPLVDGLAITDIAVFQAVKVPVYASGAVVAQGSRNAPVVVGRPALFRVYVKPSASYTGSLVTAELRLVNGTTRFPSIKDTKTISATSTDADASSTFNFDVPADNLPPGVTYQVFLTSTDGAVPKGPSTARFPNEGGVQSLEAQASGKLKVVVVPVKYDADGSGRLPDVSAPQLERYKQTFMAMYPATDVEVTARTAWSWSSAIGANGAGFSDVLDAVTQLRSSDNAAGDVYYYGAFAPKAAFSSFCNGGCVAGLSVVVDSAKTSYLRASVGLGYAGQDSVNTAAHEVGHAHGRNHAPCGGASGVDPGFPYSGGYIGTWGYDIFAKTFLSPSKGHDMMGYCQNEWVSDYTYAALFTRIAALNPVAATGGGASGSGSGSGGSSAPTTASRGMQTFRTAKVDTDGSVSWTGRLELAEEPEGGETRAVTFVGASGSTVGTHTAHFYPYDHLPGGVLVVPEAPRTTTLNLTAPVSIAHAGSAWSSIRVDGVVQTLPR